MGKLLLALDLSTAATGYALFDLETKALLKEGVFKPQIRMVQGIQYPEAQLFKMRDLAAQISSFVESLPEITYIGIEEVNRGIGRLSQKTLDGFHFILMDRLGADVKKVRYRDSDGRDGWRTQLNLMLSAQDKLVNEERRKLNKKLAKGHKKYPIITKKHLACRFVNDHYGLSLDCDRSSTDADRADAIGLGHAILARTFS